MSSTDAAPERGDEQVGLRNINRTGGLLFPLLGLACEGTDRRECKKQFRELVSYRAQAIDTAFGDLFGALPAEIQIKFVTAKDPEYLLFGGREGYDLKRRTLIFPRRVLGAKTRTRCAGPPTTGRSIRTSSTACNSRSSK